MKIPGDLVLTKYAPRVLAALLWSTLLSACDQEGDPVAYERAAKPLATAEHEWRSYLGDSEFSHASRLKQINVENVASLREIWRYDAQGAGGHGETQMQCSPIVVKGILYCTSPQLHAFALNAATGEELWRFEPPEGPGLLPNPNRGVTWWAPDGAALHESAGRILYTVGSYLYALDARSGQHLWRSGALVGG